MTSKYQIIMPEPTTNIIRNPSVETNLTDWQAQGSAIARTNDQARFGGFSVEVVTDNLAAFEGVQVRSFPNTSDTPYAGSIYVRGDGKVRLRLRDEFNGNERISDDITLNPDRWLRILDIIGRTGDGVSDDLTIHVETVTRQDVTFYVDGAMIELGHRSTTYIDGEQDGGKWQGTYHASISERVVQERSGGRFIDLDEEDLGLYTTVTSGIGMMPVSHNLQNRALNPGMEFQSTKILARPIQIQAWVRNPRACPGALRRLHQVRKGLIDLIKPDVVTPTQPFVLRYNGGDLPVDLGCYYERGMEFSGDLRNQTSNSFIMNAVATDPYWLEDDQEVTPLTLQKSLGLIDGILQRNNGDWQQWGGTLGGAVGRNSRAIVRAPDGRIYMVGTFVTAGGVVCNNAGYWDGAVWNPLTAPAFGPGFDDVVHALAIAPDGTVFMGGVFTDLFGGPGGTYNRIVSWNLVTETFTALGPGLDGTVFSIDVATDGQVYVGGAFTDLQGGIGNTLNAIARWDPFTLTWNTMGAGPGVAGGVVTAVHAAPEANEVFFGGAFNRQFGDPADTLERIATYDVATNVISELGTGTAGNVNGLDIGLNGILFITGVFTEIGGVPANRAARWDGSAFYALGSGLNNDGTRVTVLDSGEVWFGGIFTEAGGFALDGGLATWNGVTWLRPPINLPLDSVGGDPDIWRIADSGNKLFVGGNFDGSVSGDTFVAAITDVENLGSSAVDPVLEVVGPGLLLWLENLTSGQRVYFNYDLKAGETLIIDFRAGRAKVTSSWAGDVLDVVLPPSDFSNFHLAPGTNRISFFMDQITSDSRAQMRYTPQHASVDGTVR